MSTNCPNGSYMVDGICIPNNEILTGTNVQENKFTSQNRSRLRRKRRNKRKGTSLLPNTFTVTIQANQVNIEEPLQNLLDKARRMGAPPEYIDNARGLLLSYIPEWIEWSTSGNYGSLEAWMNQSSSDRIYCGGGSGCGGAGTCGQFCINGSQNWMKRYNTYHYKVTFTIWF